MDAREDLISAFGREMYAVARSWRRLMSHHAISTGLSEAQWSVIDNLNRSGDGLSQTALAERMGFERTALARVIKEMEASGLITREEGMEDARSKLILLTQMGRTKAAEVLAVVLPREKIILSDRTEAEMQLVLSLLADFKTKIRLLEQE